MNAAKVPGASEDLWDFGDAPMPPAEGYGCMQIHQIAAKQTVFAINQWRGGPSADLGSGTARRIPRPAIGLSLAMRGASSPRGCGCLSGKRNETLCNPPLPPRGLRRLRRRGHRPPIPNRRGRRFSGPNRATSSSRRGRVEGRRSPPRRGGHRGSARHDRAEKPGETIFTGASRIRLGGSHLVVSGLFLVNLSGANADWFEFRIDSKRRASFCRVTDCAFLEDAKIHREGKRESMDRDLWRGEPHRPLHDPGQEEQGGDPRGVAR